jgi:hypothetical protein
MVKLALTHSNLLSGGFLPAKVRGTKYEGLACGWDWYGTFSELAGIDPTDWRAAAAKLPPVDSHSLVPVIMGTGQSSRKEIPIGTEPRLLTIYEQPNQVSTIQGVIQEDATGKLWKLLIGHTGQSGWQGIHYPNASTDTCCFVSLSLRLRLSLPSKFASNPRNLACLCFQRHISDRSLVIAEQP